MNSDETAAWNKDIRINGVSPRLERPWSFVVHGAIVGGYLVKYNYVR